MAELKERVITTIVLVVSLIVAGLIFVLLYSSFSMEVALLVALPLGVLINVVYLLAFYEESHDAKKKVNTLTQIWAGLIIIAASVVVGILHAIFHIEVSTLMIYLTAVVLILIFVSIKKYDSYLESKIAVKPAPMVRPKPKKK